MLFSTSLIVVIALCILAGLFSSLFVVFSGITKQKFQPWMWFPGIVFGILFGIPTLRESQLIISFAIVSATIYYLAVQIAIQIWPRIAKFQLIDLFHIYFEHPDRADIIAGLVAGAFGSLALAFVLKLFSGVALDLKDEFITTAIGSGTGAIFLLLWEGDKEFKTDLPLGKLLVQYAKYTLCYVVWQVSVGLALYVSVEGKPVTAAQGSFAQGLNAFLQGPTVQLIGLIASILGIASFFMQKETQQSTSDQQSPPMA